MTSPRKVEFKFDERSLEKITTLLEQGRMKVHKTIDPETGAEIYTPGPNYEIIR